MLIWNGHQGPKTCSVLKGEVVVLWCSEKFNTGQQYGWGYRWDAKEIYLKKNKEAFLRLPHQISLQCSAPSKS